MTTPYGRRSGGRPSSPGRRADSRWPDPYARYPAGPRRRAPRHSRRVYRNRRIVALVLAVAVFVGVLFALDALVRAVLPGHSTHTATRAHTGPKRVRRTPVTVRPAGLPPVGHTTVELSAVGDTELGTTGQLPPDAATYLAGVRAALAAPVVFGNLEGTLGTAPSGKCGTGSSDCYAFQDPVAYAAYLHADGFDVLNSANNHSHDYGSEGVTQTSAALRAAHIVQAGLPGQIGVISDGSTKVAFADFAPYPTTNDLLDPGAARRLIKRAETLAPVVIVYMHAGAEGADADHVTGKEESYDGEDRGNPEAFAKAAIDDGASAVIASGPHVLRGMELYHRHLIAYSLGDFACYDNFATDGVLDLSGILHLTLSPTGVLDKASWTSLDLSGAGQPSVDPDDASATFVNQLSQSDFGSSAAIIQSDGTIDLTPAVAPTSTAST